MKIRSFAVDVLAAIAAVGCWSCGGTDSSSDGTKQIAVNGKPLYHWVNDKKAGDTTGQGVNGFHVVGVNGQKIG